MKSGMRECGRERAGCAADEICHAVDLIAPSGGHFAKCPPYAYRDMRTGGRSGVSGDGVSVIKERVSING